MNTTDTPDIPDPEAVQVAPDEGGLTAGNLNPDDPAVRDEVNSDTEAAVAAVTERPLSEAQIARNLCNHIRQRLGECAVLLNNPMLEQHDKSALDGLLATINLDGQAIKAVASSKEMSPQDKITYMKRAERAIDQAIVSLVADFFIKRYNPMSEPLTNGYNGSRQLRLESHYLRSIREYRYFDVVKFENRYTRFHTDHITKNLMSGAVITEHESESPYHLFHREAGKYEKGKTSDNREQQIAPLLRLVVNVLEKIWREDKVSASAVAAA